MYPYIENALNEGRIDWADLRVALGERDVKPLLEGKREFTMRQAAAIRDRFFPEASIDIVFSEEPVCEPFTHAEIREIIEGVVVNEDTAKMIRSAQEWAYMLASPSMRKIEHVLRWRCCIMAFAVGRAYGKREERVRFKRREQEGQ